MGFMKFSDTISGQEARAYATIDGQVEEMFYLRNFRATAEKKKTTGKTLGKRGDQHKANGWTGTGQANMYYATSRFRQMMLEYIKTGRDAYFDVMVANEDPTSTIGLQTVIVRNVNLNSTVMAALDIDAESLNEDINFTFDDVDMPNSFVKPQLG